jgi:hypothetical protein
VLFLPLVPVFIVLWVIAQLGLAKAFDKSLAYGLGLIFLPFIFIPILGYGDAEHTGQVG